MDRGHGGPNNPPARQTSSATDPRRRSKRPRIERAHIPTIPTPAQRARHAALHTGPHQATDGVSSTSAASLQGLAAGPLKGGRHAADTRPRGPAVEQRPEQGVGGQTPQSPALQAGRDGTGPGLGHQPPGQLGPYTTGLPIPAATQPNRQGGEDAPQQRGHDADDPGADEEMTEVSGPQKSSGSPLTAASCSMSPQREPSTGNVPEGHLGTTPGHPSPTGTTPDQDRETMPPPPPRPPQRNNMDLFDETELSAVYNIQANTPLCGLVAALREHLQDVNPNRLLAVVPLLHAASTDSSVRQLQALVTPGMQIADDLVDASICWSNTSEPDQGGVWVPHLGCANTLIAPPTDPRPGPSTGGRERAAPQPRAIALKIPPYNGLAEWESRTAPDQGPNLRDLVERYPPGAGTARAGPPRREDDPRTISMILLESGHYYQVRITAHPQECHWNLQAVDSMLPARHHPCRTAPLPCPKTNPQTP